MSGHQGESWNNSTGIDEDQDKHPIHFAAESLNTPKLHKLLEVNPTLIHQKYDDLTPLHIVVDSINAESFSKAFEAIKVLINFDADFNCPAIKTTFHTPFSLLLKKLVKIKDEESKRELLDLIISSYASIDVDTYREGEARFLLEKHYPTLLSRFPRVIATTDDSEVYNKDQILGKLLQLAQTDEGLFLQNLYTLKKDSRYDNILNEIVEEGVLLEATVIRGLEQSVEKLLQLGANVNRASRGSTYTPIGIACQRGYWKILKLLSSQPGIVFYNNTNGPLLHTVVKNLEITQSSTACDYYKCFDFLLNHVNVGINDQDESGNIALHYAVRYKNEYAIKRLLEKSSFIGTANIFKVLPIRDISPGILEWYFDSCITTNDERQGEDDYEIRIDYSCLVPTKLRNISRSSTEEGSYFVKELSPIQCLADTNELRHLIQHPLISSFLYLKWFRLSPIFYTNLSFYAIYCVSLISYIVFCFDEDSATAMLLRTFSLLGAVYVLIREMIQFMVAPLNYLKSPENYLEIGLIFLTWIVLCTTLSDSFAKEERRSVQHVFGAVTIMFAAVELSLLVGYLPFFSISTHMVMLKTVSMSFLRGLALYSIILVAFAFSFYTLFSGDTKKNTIGVKESKDDGSDEDELNKFVDPGRAIIKTIVMLTGEFEASSIDFNQNALSYLIFVLFLFFMSIVVLNLLNGLAVSDTQMIKSEAELNNWLERTRLLSNYEKNLLGKNNNQCQNFLIRLAFMKKGASIISLFPDFLPMHAIHIKVNQNPANQMFIPMLPAKSCLGEGGEINPLIVNSTDTTVKRLEAPLRVLSCCLAWKSCAVMDKKIVKYAKKVLDRKAQRLAEEAKQELLKERIDSIEHKLIEILEVLQKQ